MKWNVIENNERYVKEKRTQIFCAIHNLNVEDRHLLCCRSWMENIKKEKIILWESFRTSTSHNNPNANYFLLLWQWKSNLIKSI